MRDSEDPIKIMIFLSVIFFVSYTVATWARIAFSLV
tara:strand:- start:3273 stop:3380 length:108 start_codon:yes stop_codon:yes gene_type:complete